MPFTPRLKSGSGPRLLRRAAPSCRGGASSLLRLSQPAGWRLPSAHDFGAWADRAARSAGPTVSAGSSTDFAAD